MKKFYIPLIASLLCIFFAASCFVSSRQNTTETSNTNAAQNGSTENAKTETADAGAKAQNEIRKVDFKNFTYEPYCAGEDAAKITVKKGEYALDKGDDKLFFNVFEVSYGDLNGDGSEEAVILTTCNTGGTGQFSEGFVYSMKDGKIEFLTRIEGGDRAYGGLRSAKVENGLLVVGRNDVGEQGGACCPEFVVTSKYKLEGKTLKQTGGDERRELYPPQKVRFEKGATDTTVNLKLTNDEDLKRLSFSAQTGQILTVWSDTKDVSITLFKGEAEIAKEGDSLEATLKENGEFVIQVQKISDKNVNASIGIEIR